MRNALLPLGREEADLRSRRYAENLSRLYVSRFHPLHRDRRVTHYELRIT